MTNEEAKEIYLRATRSMEAKDFGGALRLLDGLDAARPNSRHVTFQRARCFIEMKQPDDAAACCMKLESKIEAERLAELRREIERVRQETSSALGADTGAGTQNGVEESNVLIVEAVFPASTEETTIRGHVKSGVFHEGDTVTVISPEGMPLLAPILRLGTADTPLKIVRGGQQVVMLLRVEPNHVVPGSSITSLVQEQSYAETMVVSSGTGDVADDEAPAAPQALLEAERLVKSGRLDEAFQALESLVLPENETRLAHRLMARILLEDEGRRNAKKALEHARRAFELGGADDSPVIDVLAETLGANGEAAHGLRFLERLYQKSNDMAARNALAGRINDFRSKHGLGHVWEFADDYGDVVFESGDIAEIAKAIGNGTIPKGSRCRRNRIGDWRNIEATLAAEFPEIGKLYRQGGKGSGVILRIAIAILSVVLAGMILYLVTR